MRNLSNIIHSLGVVAIFALPISALCAQESNAVAKVTIPRLLGNKAEWKGKKVEVCGFFVSRFEARALYENEGASDGTKDHTSLWIDFPDQETLHTGKVNWVQKGYVRIIGTFDFRPDGGSGHLGQWPARLRNIELVEPLPKPKEAKTKAASH